jgi:pyruvate kinase
MISIMNRKKQLQKRRTKIICTIGPACSDEKSLRRLIKEGMDFARFNFSHGNIEEFANWARLIRKIAKQEGRKVEIIQDLQGPRVRIGKLKHEGTQVKVGEKLILVFNGQTTSKKNEVSIQSDIALDVKKGDKILMDNGLIELEVRKVEMPSVYCVALTSGVLFSRKGLNFPNSDTKEPLTEKDLRDLEAGLAMGVDWIALSFVEDKDDILALRAIVQDKAKILAKVERPQAIKNYGRILDVVDAVMIARGDLGIEIPFWKLPSIQKRAVRRARNEGKPSIVATDMMASMVVAKRPTRAEILDVANAVIDGASAVMLSNETAVGKYPIETLICMRKIVEEAENFKTSHELESLL